MSGVHSSLCDANTSQLVVVDVQERLAAAMPEEERARVVRQSGILAEGAARLGVPITVTEQYPKGLGSTEPELADRLAPDTPVIDKTCFACGGAPRFREAVKAHGRAQIILAGMETHVCVLQTALDLRDSGYAVFVAADAVCSRDPANRENALARLRQEGVMVTNTESVLFEWLRDARHEQFKAIASLLK